MSTRSRNAKITIGAVAVVLAFFGYAHWSSAGLREVDLAMPLVADAQSWHVTHTMGAVKVEEDVVCPFEYDSTTTIGELSTREVHVGHVFYTRLSNGEWGTHGGNDFGHCSDGPRINNLGLAVALREIRENARITRGPVKEVAGYPCRVWNLLGPLPTKGTPDRVASLCIDDKHYPLELASSQETYQFTHWNQLPAIQPPQIDAAAPAQ